MTDPNTSPTDHPSARLDAFKGKLLQLRDELIVRNHLAGMEVKEAVGGVAHQVERLASRITKDLTDSIASASGDARLQGHLGMLDLKDRFEVIEEAVKKGLLGAAHQPGYLAETARLQLTLARMDAEQAAEKQAKELRRESHQLAIDTAAVLKDLEIKLGKLALEAAKYV